MERGKRTLDYCNNLSLLWSSRWKSQDIVRCTVLFYFYNFYTTHPLICSISSFGVLSSRWLDGFTCTTFFWSFQLVQQPSLISDSQGLYLFTFLEFSLSGFHQMIMYYHALCTLNLGLLFFAIVLLKYKSKQFHQLNI